MRKFKFSVPYKNLLGFNQIAKQRVIKLFNPIFTISFQCTLWPFWLPSHLHDARCCFCSHAFPGLPGTSLVKWLPDDDPPGCISDALRCSVFACSPGSLARSFYREWHHRHTSHLSVWFRWNASTSLTFPTNLRFKYCIIFNLTNLPFCDKAAKSRASSKTARCPFRFVFLHIK